MGWTLTELDEQDMARVLPGLELQAAIVRLRRFQERLDRQEATYEDLEAYDRIIKAINRG